VQIPKALHPITMKAVPWLEQGQSSACLKTSSLFRPGPETAPYPPDMGKKIGRKLMT
jgi:hypothetical protein